MSRVKLCQVQLCHRFSYVTGQKSGSKCPAFNKVDRSDTSNAALDWSMFWRYRGQVLSQTFAIIVTFRESSYSRKYLRFQPKI
jgi:hypothetical protein